KLPAIVLSVMVRVPPNMVSPPPRTPKGPPPVFPASVLERRITVPWVLKSPPPEPYTTVLLARRLSLRVTCPPLLKSPPPLKTSGLKGLVPPPRSVTPSSVRVQAGATCRNRKFGVLAARSTTVLSAPPPVMVSVLVTDGKPLGPSVLLSTAVRV